MLGIFTVCCMVAILLFLSGILFKRNLIGPEVGRKLVHMGTGIIVAFTPYFLSWLEIQILSLLFIIGVIIASNFKLFESIQSVNRSTKGEILFAVSIAICAFIEPAHWVFAAAILHLAIADAFAAVIGIKWGKRTAYTLMSHGKSMLGSLAFFYVSMAIMASAYILVDPVNSPEVFVAIVVVPAIMTFVENISWYGLDNLTIPLTLIVFLSVFS